MLADCQEMFAKQFILIAGLTSGSEGPQDSQATAHGRQNGGNTGAYLITTDILYGFLTAVEVYTPKPHYTIQAPNLSKVVPPLSMQGTEQKKLEAVRTPAV